MKIAPNLLYGAAMGLLLSIAKRVPCVASLIRFGVRLVAVHLPFELKYLRLEFGVFLQEQRVLMIKQREPVADRCELLLIKRELLFELGDLLLQRRRRILAPLEPLPENPDFKNVSDELNTIFKDAHGDHPNRMYQKKQVKGAREK